MDLNRLYGLDIDIEYVSIGMYRGQGQTIIDVTMKERHKTGGTVHKFEDMGEAEEFLEEHMAIAPTPREEDEDLL